MTATPTTKTTFRRLGRTLALGLAVAATACGDGGEPGAADGGGGGDLQFPTSDGQGEDATGPGDAAADATGPDARPDTGLADGDAAGDATPDDDADGRTPDAGPDAGPDGEDAAEVDDAADDAGGADAETEGSDAAPDAVDAGPDAADGTPDAVDATDGGVDAPDAGADGGDGDACEPKECTEIEGVECGEVPDGCGGTLDCGTCSAMTETCGGGGTPNQCGCTPDDDAELCEREEAECGEFTVLNNCNDEQTIQCGTCSEAGTCGDDHTCQCDVDPDDTQAYCDAIGASCGSVDVSGACPDIGTVECGGCEGPEATCTEALECACDPVTCESEPPDACKLIEDGCGGTRACTQGCDDGLALGGRQSCSWNQTVGASCWGDNDYGQLGVGDQDDHPLPQSVELPGLVEEMAVGERFACALVNGGVHCWGDDHFNQLLGPEPDQGSTTPVALPGLASDVKAIGAASFSACAALDGGGLRCWGDGSFGQLGHGEFPYEPVTEPQTVAFDGEAPTVVELDGGGLYNCARTEAGEVYCWGVNYAGNLGTGEPFPEDEPFEDKPTPQYVPGLNEPALDLDVGGWDENQDADDISLMDDFVCVVDTVAGTDEDAEDPAGAVKCWGSDNHGQLGNGPAGANSIECEQDNCLAKNWPVQVDGLDGGVTEVALGGGHACALMQSGEVRCWGRNQYGQVGIPSGEAVDVPTSVSGIGGAAVAIDAGYLHTCVERDDGATLCWGRNADGQLGDGTTMDSATPVQVD